jgi:hypothetical protein
MHEFHPLADIFPMLEEKDLKALAEDIKAKGLTEPSHCTMARSWTVATDTSHVTWLRLS